MPVGGPPNARIRLRGNRFTRGTDLVWPFYRSRLQQDAAQVRSITGTNGPMVSSPVTLRRGFTLIEVLVVTILVGITLGFAAPSVGRALAEQRLQRAATVIAADMRLAPSLAARQKAPVRMVIDQTNRSYTIIDRSSGTTIVTRRLGGESAEYNVATVNASPTQIDFFPNGLASAQADIIIRAGGHRRMITVTRAGHVRIAQ